MSIEFIIIHVCVMCCLDVIPLHDVLAVLFCVFKWQLRESFEGYVALSCIDYFECCTSQN